MGQAKLRGSREMRIKQVQERLELLRPDKLTCNNCKTDFTDFEMLDTRGMEGLELACVGTCPKCKDVTWGLKGAPAICRAFADDFMQSKGLVVDQVKIGLQETKKG